ncbi:unnamed protein product [Nesidiocoris tenuis]|uniref:Uncharacterized protein n=1 Tax=Nesidiocoris tenuis TaxID=355587 RepID=A0A6H5H6B5_9HEMI|nr:unnamed protein product [Nesidiocoris tenuis]
MSRDKFPQNIPPPWVPINQDAIKLNQGWCVHPLSKTSSRSTSLDIEPGSRSSFAQNMFTTSMVMDSHNTLDRSAIVGFFRIVDPPSESIRIDQKTQDEKQLFVHVISGTTSTDRMIIEAIRDKEMVELSDGTIISSRQARKRGLTSNNCVRTPQQQINTDKSIEPHNDVDDIEYYTYISKITQGCGYVSDNVNDDTMPSDGHSMCSSNSESLSQQRPVHHPRQRRHERAPTGRGSWRIPQPSQGQVSEPQPSSSDEIVSMEFINLKILVASTSKLFEVSDPINPPQPHPIPGPPEPEPVPPPTVDPQILYDGYPAPSLPYKTAIVVVTDPRFISIPGKTSFYTTLGGGCQGTIRPSQK